MKISMDVLTFIIHLIYVAGYNSQEKFNIADREDCLNLSGITFFEIISNLRILYVTCFMVI